MIVVLAEILSYIFHPVLFFLSMPFLIVYKQTESSLYALKWEIFSSVFVFIALLLVIIGKWRGFFTDYDLSTREERHVFYYFLGILGGIYLLISVFFRGLFFPLSIITAGLIFGIIIFECIDYYMKASIHIGVASAWVLTIGILFGAEAFLATIWIIPAVAWSRIVLKKHTIREAYIGGMVGTLITLLTYLIGKTFIT